ncbi:TPA: hypothetical protein AB5C86_001932 [Vibrio cholerae]
MHKLQNGSQVSVRPARKTQLGSAGYFSESNDSASPSYPGQDFFNDQIDEFENALAGGGIAYDHLRVDHLARLFAQKANAADAFVSSKLFDKSISGEPAFFAPSNQIMASCAIVVSVGGELIKFSEGSVAATPAMSAGVDYAIYATADGLIVSSNFTVPDGYTAENSRRIGGFHYGDGEIKERSFYDLHYRPACDDPRGMVRTFAGFWADIYLLNTTPDLLGTSAYGAQIADGSSTPKRPAVWGGDGAAQYSSFTQYVATEVLAAYGKRLPNAHEFSVLAHGSVTGYAASGDPVTTKFDASARSLIGCEQVSGHMWQWGAEQWDRGNGSSGYAWYAADTDSKGSVYSGLGSEGVGASLFGGDWDHSGRAGSRCSIWNFEPWNSGANIAARGVCDHLQLG